MAKKIVEDFKAGEFVDTQELAKAMEEEPLKAHIEEVYGLIAYAPFEFHGKQYKAGDVFNPGDLQRDSSFDEFRQIEKKRGETKGIAFYEVFPPRMKGDEPEVKRYILPLQEA